MRSKLKLVFDTNIFISAIIFGGNPRTCLDLTRSGEVQLYTSRSILFGLSQKLKNKFKLPNQDIQDVLEGIVKFAQVVKPKDKVFAIKADPSDNRILECALAARADYIISGDKKHLLALKKFKNTPIVSATQFLQIYYQSQKRSDL